MAHISSTFEKTLGQSVMSLFRGTWHATRDVRGRVFLFIGLFFIAYTLDLLTPWAIGYMLGILVTEGVTPEALYSAHLALAGYLLLRLGYYICHHFARYIQQTAAFTARMSVLEDLFSVVLSFPLAWQVQHHSGEKINRMYRGSGAVDATIGTYIWQFIEGITKLVFATFAIFMLDFWVANTVVAMGVATVLTIIFFNKQLVRAIRRSNRFFDRMNQILVDHLSHIITVKSFGLEDHGRKYLHDKKAEGYRLNRRIVRYGELKWAMVGLGYTLVIGVALYLYINRHPGMNKAFDIAQVYVLLNYLDRIFQAVGSFTAYYSGVLESATAYEDAANFVADAESSKPVKAGELSLADWKEIELRDILFSYGSNTTDPLTISSLTIRRGEKIALVGPSGGGKSTFLKCFGGVLIPQQGLVSVNGAAPQQLPDIYKHVLIVPQEPEIFSETFRFNLDMGSPYPQRNLDFFVSLCKLETVLEKLPCRWNSLLAENGMNLSLGERQRVAVARGLLRADAKEFLLLDEPTSSLDPINEKQLFHGVLHHFADRTIITACHRLAIVPLFDKIFYLKRGQIVEHGTFEELLALRGEFFYAWERYQEKIFTDKRE